MTQTLPANYLLFNRYEILEPIGQGGFGITYKALDRLENDLVCVKELFISGNSSRDGSLSVVSQSFGNVDFVYFKRRFLDEANTLSKINHENIVKVRDHFEVHDTAYMVMDYIKGQNLKDWIEKSGKLPEKRALDMFCQLLNAAEAIHAQNILHRDIKPDNIIVTNDEKLVLIDFGTAKFNDNAVHNHSTFVVVNHGYAPPEQFSVEAKKDTFTDVYALGATLYFMLTAQKPAPPSDRMIEDLKPIKAFNTELSEKVQAAIFKALNLKPSERFQSVDAFRKALFSNANSSGEPTVDVNNPPKPPMNKWPWIGGLGLVALLFFVFLLYPRNKEIFVAENPTAEEVDSSASSDSSDKSIDANNNGTKNPEDSDAISHGGNEPISISQADPCAEFKREEQKLLKAGFKRGDGSGSDETKTLQDCSGATQVYSRKKKVEVIRIKANFKKIEQNTVQWSEDLKNAADKITIVFNNGTKTYSNDVTGKNSFVFSSGDKDFDGVDCTVELLILLPSEFKLLDTPKLIMKTHC